MEAIQIATYILITIFIVGLTLKFLKYQTMPTHLRWELYPLAGEKKRPYGGSYLEEPDWTDKPHEEKSFLGEMEFMGKEILYFKQYLQSNRSLWFIVFPFHVGLYIFVAFVGLLIIGALTMVGDITVSAESSNVWGKLVHYITLISGISAFILGTIGCSALFIKKIVDPTMSPYTRRIEYLNIFFVLAVFFTGFLSWVVVDITFESTRAYMYGLITFGKMENIPTLVTVHTMLLAVLVAYFPFTNMMHFIMKHFTFNAVRWNDEPNRRGSKLERSIVSLLEHRINWAAPHTQTINRWSDVAKSESESGIQGRVSQKGDS